MFRLTKYGYYEIENKPSEEELSSYYAKKYYQNGAISTYRHEYPEAELKYFRSKIEQKYTFLIEKGLLKENGKYKLLDVGCGEGFTLNFFHKKNWDVVGLDFSSFGCSNFHPNCLQHVIEGDIYKNLDQLIEKGTEYDLIWLDNVLEHVLAPLDLLNRLKKVVSKNGVLIIEVPNDFSIVQNRLFEKGTLKERNWVITPDHLSYFNLQGLNNLCKDASWSNIGSMADFPIDWFLFNEHSNYYADKAKGKAAHEARVELENLIHEQDRKKTIRLFEALSDIGLGRQIIGFYKKDMSE